jgi:hypothetical protein
LFRTSPLQSGAAAVQEIAEVDGFLIVRHPEGLQLVLRTTQGLYSRMVPDEQSRRAIRRALTEPWRLSLTPFFKQLLIWRIIAQADAWAQQSGWEPGPSDAYGRGQMVYHPDCITMSRLAGEAGASQQVSPTPQRRDISASILHEWEGALDKTVDIGTLTPLGAVVTADEASVA